MYESIVTENDDGSKTVRITNLRMLVLGTGRPAYHVAAQAGIHHSMMSLYLAGKKDLKVEHLANLTEVLDVDASDIVGERYFRVDSDGAITPADLP